MKKIRTVFLTLIAASFLLLCACSKTNGTPVIPEAETTTQNTVSEPTTPDVTEPEEDEREDEPSLFGIWVCPYGLMENFVEDAWAGDMDYYVEITEEEIILNDFGDVFTSTYNVHQDNRYTYLEFNELYDGEKLWGIFFADDVLILTIELDVYYALTTPTGSNIAAGTDTDNFLLFVKENTVELTGPKGFDIDDLLELDAELDGSVTYGNVNEVFYCDWVYIPSMDLYLVECYFDTDEVNYHVTDDNGNPETHTYDGGYCYVEYVFTTDSRGNLTPINMIILDGASNISDDDLTAGPNGYSYPSYY